MNAQTLIGTVLGTCTLQKLVGQGGMGAVFLAQQSRPRRQVAVKVLLPMTPLNANQLAAFLERFRRETDAAASLEHPNIMPVHEYGEQGGIAYLVMPYISGGTLRDELERKGALPLQKTLDYLEQIAFALDFAHEHGVIHRDIKPANIMVTNEGRLLLTDFGLVKIVAEGQKPQVRLTGAGAPIGTPDYMAPEQVIGEEVDTRADLYSLGVILFQMLTGTTPFQGETPMQIAAQHLQIPPPSPQMLRPDLPIAAEQVVLRALSKRPTDRYMYAQDMVNAFRSALIKSGIAVEATSGLISGTTASRLAISKGQFDPIRQTASMPKLGKNNQPIEKAATQVKGKGLLTRAGMPSPAVHNNPLPNSPLPTPGAKGLLSRNGMLSSKGKANNPVAETVATSPQGPGGGLLSKTGKFPKVGAGTAIQPGGTHHADNGLRSKAGQFPAVEARAIPPTPIQSKPAGSLSTWTKEPSTTSTGAPWEAPTPSALNTTKHLSETDQQQRTTTMKLNDPVKVVKVPIAGRPGHFVTGLLPFTKTADDESMGNGRQSRVKFALIVIVMLILLGSIGAYLLIGKDLTTTLNGLNPQVQATATANDNTVLADPLDHNIHGWLVNPPGGLEFKDGAYHITDHGNNGNGAYLPNLALPNPLVYTITMQEVKGDDADPNNTFGVFFRYNQQQKSDKIVRTFYSFEVVNIKGGVYQFWRYDENNSDNPWVQIGANIPFGKEFHQGQGPNAANTIQIKMDGSKFTVTVNGKTLPKTFQDDTYKSGSIGMMVNKDGTEVAYKNLLLTH